VRRVLASPGRLLAGWWRTTPVLLVALIALVVGLGAGSAWAFFSSSASGSGAGSVGRLQVSVISVTGTAKLYPGLTTGLSVTITNPNAFTVTVTSLAETGGSSGVTVTGAKGTCSGTTAEVAVKSLTGSLGTVAPGTHTITITTSVSMGTTSPTGCQGATFHIPIKLTVEKS
jgi:hypothetical protein